MNKTNKTFDQIWEKKYLKGHSQLYPWDIVVSFIYRNIPQKISNRNIKILELGFGTGPNLWFAAREGFKVYGIEASSTAVKFAKKRFESESLKGNLLNGNFINLPFKNDYFDLVIDRCSLVCVGAKAQKLAIQETFRVLKKGGKFLHNTYSTNHSCHKLGQKGEDGLTINIKDGPLAGSGQLYFNSESDIKKKFLKNWKILQLQKRKHIEKAKNDFIHEEWVLVAEKV